MLQAKTAFSSLSVDDIDKARAFYTQVLGLPLEREMMGLHLRLPGGGTLFLYAKEGHQPATFTVLNFVVDNIDEAVDGLAAAGVTFERYDNMPGKQDEKGILRGRNANCGPDIAWFQDPAGNILAVLQDT